MKNQLNRGLQKRLMYVENKDGDIDGASARIGWVSFSKTGKTVYYRGLELTGVSGKQGGSGGNFVDLASGCYFWVSGVKKRGSNAHPAEAGVAIRIDEDALDAYRALTS